MPRVARKIAESGIYHVMLRGINRQQIFEDEDDEALFLSTLKKYKAECGYEILAYCLMGNHVHLLLMTGSEPLGTVIRRIAGRYVYWFNMKYSRVGHLFQDRFKSEPVEDEAYLLTVMRYIHRNPVEAGLCVQPGDYAASSYLDYLGRNGITDTKRILAMMDRNEFVDFNAKTSDDRCLDLGLSPRPGLSETDARSVISMLSGCSDATAFQSLPHEQRDDLLVQIVDTGVSLRQASRLTGIPIGVIRGAVTRSRRIS